MNQHISLKHLGNAIGDEINQASLLLASVGAAISIFGGSRVPVDSEAYRQAYRLAELLAQQDVAVVSGGGPGIMEAANRGAHLTGGTSIGLNISLPHEQNGNEFQTIAAPFFYFPSRKTTFVAISDGFVAFAGGFGTLDEVFEVLTLVQTGKNKQAPVILVGREFWTGLVEWVKTTLVPMGLVGPLDHELLIIADDAEHAAKLLAPTITKAKLLKQRIPVQAA